MIGLIITGHGHFASGLLSAIELIAGPQDQMEAVDFGSLDNTDGLQANLQKAAAKLSDCSAVIVFTDLIGGSPFKTAVTIWMDNPAFRVLSGTNLGEVLEIVMNRSNESDVDLFIDRALQLGRQQLVKFSMPEPVSENNTGEGI